MTQGNGNDIPRNAMRAAGEQDRSDEFKAARDGLVLSVRGLLDDVEQRQADGQPLGTFGAIHDSPGIVRTTIASLMSEGTKSAGVYFHHDSETGQRNLVVVSPDKVLEVIDNPLEQQLAGPEAGYAGVSATVLGSFSERLPDGSYVGAEVTAAGNFSLKKFDGQEGSPHIGITLTHSPEQIELVGGMWTDIQTELVGTPPTR